MAHRNVIFITIGVKFGRCAYIFILPQIFANCIIGIY